MNKRIHHRRFLGGIAMFIWTSIAHMALPLGEAGVREIPNEPGSAVRHCRPSWTSRMDFIFFPDWAWDRIRRNNRKAKRCSIWPERYAQNPSGLLVYHPPGRAGEHAAAVGGRVCNRIGRGGFSRFSFWPGPAWQVSPPALVLSFLSVSSRESRPTFLTGIGTVFPAVYTAAYIFIQIIGFACVGLVAALVLRTKAN